MERMTPDAFLAQRDAAVQSLRRLRSGESGAKLLRPLLDRIGPCTWTLAPFPSVLDALCRSIVYQQLSGKAAATIHRRLLALFPRHRLPAAATLATTPIATLRSAGLSASKAAALIDLAERVSAKKLPTAKALQTMADEAVIEQLITVRGIGRWSAEMLLMFRLGRLNVWPVDDYGVRKGYAKVFGGALPTPKALHAAGEPWHPYRSIVAWYLWRALDV